MMPCSTMPSAFPPPRKLSAELSRIGLSVSHAKVHCNPLSGQADGRGEIQLRGVEFERQLVHVGAVERSEDRGVAHRV